MLKMRYYGHHGTGGPRPASQIITEVPASNRPKVEITLDGAIWPMHSKISGWIELKRNETYCGLIVEMLGYYVHANTSYPILPTSSGCKMWQRFSGSGVKGDTMTSRASSKFPFELVLPRNGVLPGTFRTKSGQQVYYILRVSAERGPIVNSQLGRKAITYGGNFHLRNIEPSVVRKEISLPELKLVLEIPKRQYLVYECIPFVVNYEGESSSVKRIKVSLIRSISHNGQESDQASVKESTESETMDCITFRRFLKRERFSRSGSLSVDKDALPSPTFMSRENKNLRIRYAVKIKVTINGQSEEIRQIEVVFGTEMLNPTDDGDTPPSPPPPLDLDFPSRFPPSYSQLPSKVGSVVSLETLPPHYEDLY